MDFLGYKPPWQPPLGVRWQTLAAGAGGGAVGGQVGCYQVPFLTWTHV